MNNFSALFQYVDIPALEKKIADSKSIIITAHKSPDGDAVGSTLALWNTLSDLGKNVTVILPDGFPSFLKWMKGSDKIVLFDSEKEKAEKLFSESDIIFCLDYNDFSRVGDMKSSLQKSTAYKIMIDHHPDPSNETDILISSTSECATAQIIYQFIVEMNWKKYLSVKGAECIYCGMMTDTGSFRFPSTSAKTHFIVSELMAIGMSNSFVHNQVFDNDSESRLRLVGYAISEKMKVMHEYKTAYFILTEEELKRFNYQSGDTEGLVNYGLAIKGIQMSAIFIERGDLVKISFRSKGTLPVNEFSKKYFNGGGHMNAAGGAAHCNILEAESLFLEKLPDFIRENEI
jgi:phosphoesterase RecJ-like protein